MGGGFEGGFFHTPEYLTDHDGTEAGKIASVNSLVIQDATYGNVTATTAAGWGDGTDTPRAGAWIAASDNASKVIHLPPCFLGARVEYIMGSHSGFKLRAEVASDYINNVTGEEEAIIPSTAKRVIATGIAATMWLVNYYDASGNFETIGADVTISSTNEDINITATNGSVNVTATEDVADAIVLSATAGGIDISAVGESGQDIDIRNIGGSVHLYSTEDITNAISLTTTAGGIAINATGEAGQDIVITNNGGSVGITSTEAAADAVVIASSGGIDITASGGATPIDITSAANISISAGSDGSGSLSLDGPDGTAITNLQDQLATFTTITDSTITAAYDTEYVINDANGGAMGLPAAKKGTRIRFIIGTTISSNTLTITAMGGDLLKGYAICQRIDNATDNLKTVVSPNGSSDLILTLNGGDQGGLAGDVIDLWGVSGTEWRIRANLTHTGTLDSANLFL